MGKKMNFQHDGSTAIFEAYSGLVNREIFNKIFKLNAM